MFSTNPFAALSSTVSPDIMQIYVIVMIVFVVAGTLIDIVHKKSARYFFENWRKVKDKGAKKVGGGEMVSLAAQTAAVEVLTSAEFCNQKRRIAHLLTMYGFIIYVVTTAIMVFSYPTPETATPAILPNLWYLGGLMVCVGGYWFWFFIRVDVAAEGHSPFRIVRADMFILSLLVSTTAGLIWAVCQASGSAATGVFLGIYLLATTFLFASVPWSKFSHMFFKPAAAMQKRIETANGTRRNLPPPADKPATLGDPTQLPRNY